MAERYRGLRGRVCQDHGSARKEWERTTEQQRHLALAANSEYLRRHPDTDLPPLKSAEPPRPSEEERAQLHVPETEYEPPSWLADMAERNRAALERIEELRSMEIPAKITSGRDSRPGRKPPPCSETRSCSRLSPRSGQLPKSPSGPPRSTGKLEIDSDVVHPGKVQAVHHQEGHANARAARRP